MREAQVTEHKQEHSDGTPAPSYYTDYAGRICDRFGTPFRNHQGGR